MTFWWHLWDKLTQTVLWCVFFFGCSEAVGVCGSCTLAVLVGCGLSSVCLCILGSFFFFAFDSFSFLSLLPPCRVFLRTSCCLVITVWLSPSSSVVFLSRWSLLQPPQLCSLLYLLLSLSVVVLHHCRFFFVCLFLGWSFEFFFCLLTCFLFWLSDTPSPLPAVRCVMVQCCACLQFCGWSVGFSPVRVELCHLVLCCGLSSEWTMCIKLHSSWFDTDSSPHSECLNVILRLCCPEIRSLIAKYSRVKGGVKFEFFLGIKCHMTPY